MGRGGAVELLGRLARLEHFGCGIEPAKTFWRREHPSKAFPVELNDQTIGNVTHPHPT